MRILKKIKAGFDKFGCEIADKRKVAVPANFETPETLEQQMARMVRGALSAQQQQQGRDSFEEYDDFEDEESTWDSQFVVKYIEEPPVEDSPKKVEKKAKPSSDPAKGGKGESNPPAENDEVDEDAQ